MIDMYDDYEFLDCSCSQEQKDWQERTTKALIPLGMSLRDSISRFNTLKNHIYTLDEQVTVDIMSEWLKYFNSFQLLVKYGKFDVSLTILRSLLELSLQLGYLLIKDKELKAAYYFVSFFIKGHQHNALLLDGRTDVVALETLKKNDTILDRIKNHTDINAQKAYNNVLPGDAYNSKDAQKEWYKLYYDYEVKANKKDHFSITQMLDVVANELDPSRLLLKKGILYGTLSIHAHGLIASMNASVVEGVQQFKSFEDTRYAAWILNVIAEMTQLNFLSLRKGYPDFQWISDDELIKIRAGVDEAILEWADKFKE